MFSIAVIMIMIMIVTVTVTVITRIEHIMVLTFWGHVMSLIM